MSLQEPTKVREQSIQNYMSGLNCVRIKCDHKIKKVEWAPHFHNCASGGGNVHLGQTSSLISIIPIIKYMTICNRTILRLPYAQNVCTRNTGLDFHHLWTFLKWKRPQRLWMRYILNIYIMCNSGWKPNVLSVRGFAFDLIAIYSLSTKTSSWRCDR